MPHIAQHQAAELWELCRDHAVSAAKLRALAQSCQDSQLRSTLERHASEFQQAAQRLMQFLQEPGSAAHAGQGHAGWQGGWQADTQATWRANTGATWQAHGHQAVNQSYGHGYGQSYGQAAGFAHAGYTADQARGERALDIALASDCLRLCKTFAVQCIWGATESSEPARTYLYQLAGEHLRMAQEHYRWLEQQGVYASPKADQQAIHEYTSKLNQLFQIGQSVAGRGLQHAFAQAGSPGFNSGHQAYGSGHQAYAGTTHGYGTAGGPAHHASPAGHRRS